MQRPARLTAWFLAVSLVIPASAIAPVATASVAASGVARAADLRAPDVKAETRAGSIAFTWSGGSRDNRTDFTWDVRVSGAVESNSTVKVRRFSVSAPAGQAVTVRVRTRSGSDVGAWSAPVTARAVPPAPRGVGASNVTQDGARISWRAVSGATAYDVYVNGSRVQSVAAPQAVADLSGLSPATTYTAHVVAKAGSQTSAPSSNVRFTTLEGAPLDPASVEVKESTPTQVTISWSAVVGADYYIVFLNGSQSATIYAPNTSTTIRGLTAGDTYGVRVISVKGGVSSAPGATVGFVAPLSGPTEMRLSSITQTAAILSWAPMNGVTGYEVTINGALLSASWSLNSYTFTGLTAGQTYSVGVRGIYSGPRFTERSSLPMTMLPDPSQVPNNTFAPTIESFPWSAPIPGLTLRANVGGWTSATPITYSYQWQRSYAGSGDYVDIAGATASTYLVTDKDIRYSIRIRITASNPNGGSSRSSSATANVAIVAPSEMANITGFAVVGQALTYQDVEWYSNPPPALTLMWQTSSNGSSWTDDTLGLNYTLTSSHFDKYIRVAVTATAPTGKTTYYSITRGPILATINTVSPVVQGETIQGRVLRSNVGTWVPSTTANTYAWQRSTDGGASWTRIVGASSATYLTTAADVGAYIRSAVTGSVSSIGGSTPIVAMSAPVGPVTAMPNLDCVTAPTVLGVPRVGSAMTATAGTWSGATSIAYNYQWQLSSDGVSWSDISGAISSEYSPVAGDAGKFVRARVIASVGTVSAIATSAASSKVNAPSATAAPQISGAERVAGSLTATTGTWAGAVNTPTSYTYQWQHSADGIVWDDTAVTTATITPSATLGAKRLRVAVSATNANGTTVTYSVATSSLLPPLPSAAPVISGSAQVGQTLTTTDGSWSGATVAVTYQWQASTDGGVTWSNVADATSSSFTVPITLQAALIRSRTSVVYSSGTSSAYSDPVGPVRP